MQGGRVELRNGMGPGIYECIHSENKHCFLLNCIIDVGSAIDAICFYVYVWSWFLTRMCAPFKTVCGLRIEIDAKNKIKKFTGINNNNENAAIEVGVRCLIFYLIQCNSIKHKMQFATSKKQEQHFFLYS